MPGRPKLNICADHHEMSCRPLKVHLTLADRENAEIPLKKNISGSRKAQD